MRGPPDQRRSDLVREIGLGQSLLQLVSGLARRVFAQLALDGFELQIGRDAKK